MLTNRPEFVVAVHAVHHLGAAVVLVSPAWKATEVEHAVRLTKPVHGVADGPSVPLLRQVLPVTDVDDVAVPHQPADRVQVARDDEAVLVFSSGTTGMPKAVRHTHRSLRVATRHWVDALGLTDADRFQVTTPPSHILGLLNLLAAADAGATVRLHPRFDLDEVLHRIASERMTLEMVVAPIALAMANHPNLEALDLSSLRFILWGATPVTEVVARSITERTGVRFLAGYGASELPVISVNPVRQPDRWRLDAVGLPVPGVELRVVDLTTGEPLPTGEVGEIQARSPSVMAGYLPDEANAEAFVGDGWYRTGDVGFVEPEGWVHLTDRSKEMIKVSGFQVAPAEIEAVLHGHPAVLDCAVFGVPDDPRRRVAGRGRAGRSVEPRRRPTNCASSSPARWRPTSSCATSSSSRPSPDCRRERCCGVRCATSGWRGRERGGLNRSTRRSCVRTAAAAGRRGSRAPRAS